MKNLVFYLILTLGAFFMSCTKTEIVPATPITTVVDDSEVLLQQMKNTLIGSWNVTITQTMYPTTSPTDTTSWTAFAVFGEVDCAKENQWDYLKSITISQLTDTPDTYRFKVVNEYYCRPNRITIFELRLEKPDNTFLITEKATSNQPIVIKYYRVINTTNKNVQYLTSRSFDPSYFHHNNVGSIKFPPTEYSIRIEKQ